MASTPGLEELMKKLLRKFYHLPLRIATKELVLTQFMPLQVALQTAGTPSWNSS